jgi:hypothetical protein
MKEDSRSFGQAEEVLELQLRQRKTVGCGRVGIEILGIELDVFAMMRSNGIVQGVQRKLNPGVARCTGDSWQLRGTTDLGREVLVSTLIPET